MRDPRDPRNTPPGLLQAGGGSAPDNPAAQLFGALPTFDSHPALPGFNQVGGPPPLPGFSSDGAPGVPGGLAEQLARGDLPQQGAQQSPSFTASPGRGNSAFPALHAGGAPQPLNHDGLPFPQLGSTGSSAPPQPPFPQLASGGGAGAPSPPPQIPAGQGQTSSSNPFPQLEKPIPPGGLPPLPQATPTSSASSSPSAGHPSQATPSFGSGSLASGGLPNAHMQRRGMGGGGGGRLRARPDDRMPELPSRFSRSGSSAPPRRDAALPLPGLALPSLTEHEGEHETAGLDPSQREQLVADARASIGSVTPPPQSAPPLPASANISETPRPAPVPLSSEYREPRGAVTGPPRPAIAPPQPVPQSAARVPAKSTGPQPLPEAPAPPVMRGGERARPVMVPVSVPSPGERLAPDIDPDAPIPRPKRTVAPTKPEPIEPIVGIYDPPQRSAHGYRHSLESLLADRSERVALTTGNVARQLLSELDEAHSAQRLSLEGSPGAALSLAMGLAQEGQEPLLHGLAAELCHSDLQLLRGVSYSQLPLRLIGLSPGLFGASADLQALDDLALLSALPNWHIFSLGDQRELPLVLHALMQVKGPAYLRLPLDHEELPLIFSDPPRGLTRRLRGEAELLIISHGVMSGELIRALPALEAGRVSWSLLHLNQLYPLPEEHLNQALQETRRAVLCLDHHLAHGGLSSWVAEHLLHFNQGRKRPLRFSKVAVQGRFTQSGSVSYLLKKYSLDASSIVSAVEQLLNHQISTTQESFSPSPWR